MGETQEGEWTGSCLVRPRDFVRRFDMDLIQTWASSMSSIGSRFLVMRIEFVPLPICARRISSENYHISPYTRSVTKQEKICLRALGALHIDRPTT